MVVERDLMMIYTLWYDSYTLLLYIIIFDGTIHYFYGYFMGMFHGNDCCSLLLKEWEYFMGL